MPTPGWVYGNTGLFHAIKRLEAAQADYRDSSGLDDASMVPKEVAWTNAAWESIHWLFALNEDLKENLGRGPTNPTIFDFWTAQGAAGRRMNGLRLVRNRMTHSQGFYTSFFDWNKTKDGFVWQRTLAPTQDEINRSSYVTSQHTDYTALLEGELVTPSLGEVQRVLRDELMKYGP